MDVCWLFTKKLSESSSVALFFYPGIFKGKILFGYEKGRSMCDLPYIFESHKKQC